MTLTDVEVAHVRLPPIAMQAYGTLDAAACSPHVVQAIVEAPRSHSVMVGLREVLIGENPRHTERLWRKIYEALDEDGCIIIPQGPGLGIELDMDVFECYRVG